MRKRLRKKRRLGEFRENAFDVSYTLRQGVSADEAEDFLFRFVEQAIEANDLSCGGGGQGESWELCVTSAGRGSPTEQQRGAVSEWLANQPAVRSHNLGAFFDAWHEPEQSLQSGRTIP
jgi:uncharacterized protein YggL (DUF469 family)